MKGYDMDGVITAGIVPETNAVIITGRSYEQATETYRWLHKRGIFNAVYFNPASFHQRSLRQSGEWKARMIKQLGVTDFYEDSELQAQVIMVRFRHTLTEPVRVHKVVDGCIKGFFFYRR